MRTSSQPMITESAWNEISPLLPASGGKRRVDDRRALEGILHVLSHGIAWYDLPPNLGYGSGMTCWRRLRDWHHQGAWDTIQHILVRHLPKDRIDFSRIAGGESRPESRAEAESRKARRRRVRTSFLGATAVPPPPPTAWTHHAQVKPARGRNRP